MSEKNLTLPGNPRYQPKSLRALFGYDNLYVPIGEVELAALEVLSEVGYIRPEDMVLLDQSIRQGILSILTSEVDRVEREVTKHDIRAWVRIAQEKLPPPLRKWPHVLLTSYDPLETGRVLQYSRAYQSVLKPNTREVVCILIALVRRFAGTLQIGRTHGQHALPITVGFWLATILHRLLYNAEKMEQFAEDLVGKISGAVGAYNAQLGLKIEERCGAKTFEKRVLEKLGLKPAPISTQILPPEPLAFFLFSCVTLSGALGQFGDDCRHLARTEIAEIAEPFKKGQVGSSTMAHKRNPWRFEGLKGDFLKNIAEFVKVMLAMTSEHQRDMVAGRLMRDFPIILVNLTTQFDTLLQRDDTELTFLERINIFPERCKGNFRMMAHVILAEPIYIALQMAGYDGDAHALINDEAVPIALEKNRPLIEVVELFAETNEELAKALARVPGEIRELLYTPENYTGEAEKKAHEIADMAEAYLQS
jgi:adenylosuccinate lyase